MLGAPLVTMFKKVERCCDLVQGGERVWEFALMIVVVVVFPCDSDFL